jgi:hypothetical protein
VHSTAGLILSKHKAIALIQKSNSTVCTHCNPTHGMPTFSWVGPTPRVQTSVTTKAESYQVLLRTETVSAPEKEASSPTPILSVTPSLRSRSPRTRPLVGSQASSETRDSLIKITAQGLCDQVPIAIGVLPTASSDNWERVGPYHDRTDSPGTSSTLPNPRIDSSTYYGSYGYQTEECQIVICQFCGRRGHPEAQCRTKRKYSNKARKLARAKGQLELPVSHPMPTDSQSSSLCQELDI